jgi:hypothetical protein
MKKVAIVGAQELTRDKAPWDDLSYDIWLVNEWAMMPWAKRYTATIDIHWQEIFTDPKYDRNEDKNDVYYEWLKTPRGKPVYMQRTWPEIPDVVEYPIHEINRKFLTNITYEKRPIKNFRSSINYATALALYQGYEQIDYYGIELAGTEYKGQMSNFNFWIGVAVGRGVLVNLYCSKASFVSPLYGYEAFMKNSRVDQYYNAMLTQLEEKKREVNMLEGALQITKQMVEDEQKDDVNEPD